MARLVAMVVAGLVASIGASCVDDISFASVALSVREPQDQERFGSPALTGLQWTIDKKFRASVAKLKVWPFGTLQLS